MFGDLGRFHSHFLLDLVAISILPKFGLEACCQVAAVLNPTLTSGSVEGIIKDWLGMEADMQHKFVAHGGCGVVVIMFV